METISIDHSRKDAGKILLLAFIMFGASLLLLLGGMFTDYQFNFMGIRSKGFAVFAGVLGTVFFGYAFFFLSKRFLFPKGALIINEEGIINQTNAIGTKQVIPFSEMKKAKIEMVNAKANIGIELLDNEKYTARLPWLKRKATEINHNQFNTSIISLEVPVESREELKEIVDIINQRIEKAKQN